MNLDFEIDNIRFNARASAIIYNKDKTKVLLFKIVDRDYFMLPGGRIEIYEDSLNAIKREIKEELDCNIIIEKFITTINYEYNTFLLTMHVYLCHLKDNEPILLEHKASLWCDKDKLKTLDFAVFFDYSETFKSGTK